MKLRNVRLFMVLLASLLMLGEQSVAAVGVLQSESKPVVVEVSGQKDSYFSVSGLPVADKLIKLSINELRFLKAYSKKADAQKHLSLSQNVLLPEIKSIVAGKKSASLGIIAPNEYDSAVILFSFDQKGVMTYAIYGTEDECPEWLLPTIAASVTAAQKSGFSWLTITGIVAGVTASVVKGVRYLNNLFATDEIIDIQDFAPLQPGQFSQDPCVYSLEGFIARKDASALDIFVDGTKICLRLSKTIPGLFQSNDYGPIIDRVLAKYAQNLNGFNLNSSGLIVQDSRILFKLQGTGTYDITTILYPTEPEVLNGFVSDITPEQRAALEQQRLLEEQRREERQRIDDALRLQALEVGAGTGAGAGADAEREVKPSFADSLKVALSGSSKKLSNDELRRLITERDYSNSALTESEKTGASGNLFDEIHNGLLLGNWEYTKDLLLPAAAARPELSHEPKLIVFVGSLTQKIADTLAEKQISELTGVEKGPEDTTLLLALEGVQSELKKLCGLGDFQPFVEGELYSCEKDDVTILYLPMSENSQAQGNVFASQFVPYKDRIFAQIDQFLADGKSVLIHCMEGCNRSMAITTAYLHEKVGDAHSFKDIISFIASKRAGVKQLPDLFTAYKVTANRARPAIGPCLLGVIEHYLAVTAVRADLPVVVPAGAPAGAGSGAGAREGAGEEERKDGEEREDLGAGAGSFDLRSVIAALPEDILNEDGSVNFSHSRFNAVRETVRAEISQKTESLADIQDQDLAGLIPARGVTDAIGRLNRIEKLEAEELYGAYSFLETVGSYFAVGGSLFSEAIVASQALMSIEDISKKAMPLPYAIEELPQLLDEQLKFKIPSRVPGLVVICASPGDVPWFKDNNVAQSKGIVVPRESGIATMYVPLVEEKNVDSFGEDFIKQVEMCKALDKAVAASLLNDLPVFFDCNSGSNRSTTMLQFYLKKLCPEISWRKINAWVAYHRNATQRLEDAFNFNVCDDKGSVLYGYGKQLAVRDLIVHDFKQRGLLPESYNIYASEVASPAALPLPLATHSVGGAGTGALAGQVGPQESGGLSWICSCCTLANDGSAETCSACSQEKPSAIIDLSQEKAPAEADEAMSYLTTSAKHYCNKLGDAISIYSCQGGKLRPRLDGAPSSVLIRNEDALDVYCDGDWVGLAVYDGHAGGRRIADWLAGKDHQSFLFVLLNLIESENDDLINRAFSDFDYSLRAKLQRDFPGELLTDSQGSTAGVCLYNKRTKQGYLIVLGDSQVVVVNKDKTFTTLDPHAVSQEAKDAGWPLDHSFGDFSLKVSNHQFLMSIVPKVFALDLSNAAYIAVCSDGVYEHNRVRVADTGSYIEKALSSGIKPAEYLCRAAVCNASQNESFVCLGDKLRFDHTTAIVLDVQKYLAKFSGDGHADSAGLVSEPEVLLREAPLAGAGAGAGAGHGAGEYSEALGGSSRGRRSEPSTESVELTATLRDRLDQLVSGIKSFESGVLRRNRIADVNLLRQLHLDPTAYPVRSFPEQQVFETTNLFNAAQPFHKIIDGLYLGNNELTVQLKDNGRVDLTQFKNVTYLNAETFEKEVAPNNENMDKPPTLIICLDKNDRLYSSIQSTAHIEFIYFPLDEKEGDDFNDRFIPTKKRLFDRIIDHLSRADGRVLIHCAQGNHRSVSVLHCFLFETLKQFGNQTDLYSINQFIKYKRSFAMGFAQLAEKEYKNNGTPCMPSASSMLYQTLLHCCGSVSGA